MADLTPVYYWAAGFGLSVAALHTKQFTTRAGLVGLAGALMYMALINIRAFTRNPLFIDACSLGIVIGTINGASILLFERYELPSLQSGERRVDILGGISLFLNPRRIGLPSEAPGLRRRANQTRWGFVLRRLGSLVVMLVLEKLFNAPMKMVRASDVHPNKMSMLRRLGDVSTRELLIRCLLIPDYFATGYVQLALLHDLLAAVYVGIGTSEPDDWPYLFGNISDACTVAGLWGKFWHRIIYRPYMSISRTVVLSIPGVRHGTALYRILVVASVFTVSGVAHAGFALGMGYRCGIWSDFHFRFLTALAIALEEFVQRTLKQLGVPTSGIVQRCLGFVWVLLFLFWSLPKVYFPLEKWSCRPKS